MIIGTAGHIDHGKSSLVHALTGVDPDRLAEEKARGITIDLGYAYQMLPDGGVLAFVDVPGHERLVHTMLAGATGIDFVLLVIAADDGPMPQTREHLDIVELLGLSRGAVAITKIDKVSPERLDQVRSEVAVLLAPTGLARADVFGVSSKTGEGIDALRDFLYAAASTTPQRSDRGRFRLAIDRCFTLAGAGTVVTGTVHSGCVRVGERLRLSDGSDVRVRSIHAHNRPADAAGAGLRCALNIAGNGLEKNTIRRGDWLLDPDLHAPSARFDALLRVPPWGTAPVRHWTPVHVHMGAADIVGRIAVLNGESILPGANGWVQLVLNKPTVALWGDRFVVRDQSAMRTLGGGRIVDNAPPLRGRRAATRLAHLGALQEADPVAALVNAAEYVEGIDLAHFALARNIDHEVLAAAAAQSGLTVVGATRPMAFTAQRWQAMEDAVISALAREHVDHPYHLGPDKERLRRLGAPALARPAFAALLNGLALQKRIVLSGPAVHLPSHAVTLAPADEGLWRERIRPLLAVDPFNPPRLRDVARTLGMEEAPVRALMHQLCAMAEVHRIAHDHYFTLEAVQSLAAIVRDLAAAEGEVLAAPFRDRIGTGRKLAIQILEFFDRLGVSRRVGDAHRVFADTLLT